LDSCSSFSTEMPIWECAWPSYLRVVYGFTSKINTNWSSDDSLQHLGGNLWLQETGQGWTKRHSLWA